MGKKKKISYVFADNLPKKNSKVSEPKDSSVEETPVANEVEATEEASSEEEVIEDSGEELEPSGDPTRINYPVLKYPKGTPDSGILLCIMLSLITLVSLGFLIYHEHTWRQQEEQEQENNIDVNSKYKELSTVINMYVQTIKEPKVGVHCAQLKTVYLEASKSSKDLESIEEGIRQQSRKILDFENPDRDLDTSSEYMWQKLLGSTGVINTWLSNEGIKVTKDNYKEIYTAIAKGFE